jgi:hypothetical protein
MSIYLYINEIVPRLITTYLPVIFGFFFISLDKVIKKMKVKSISVFVLLPLIFIALMTETAGK